MIFANLHQVELSLQVGGVSCKGVVCPLCAVMNDLFKIFRPLKNLLPSSNMLILVTAHQIMNGAFCMTFQILIVLLRMRYLNFNVTFIISFAQFLDISILVLKSCCVFYFSSCMDE